jgi:hypothetical protein
VLNKKILTQINAQIAQPNSGDSGVWEIKANIPATHNSKAMKWVNWSVKQSNT